MNSRWWRFARAGAGAAVLYFLGSHLLQDWQKLQDQEKVITWQLNWLLIGGSVVLTWAMYALLIWGWRAVLAGWRQELAFLDAARIWTVSSLARYVPIVGKLMAIGNMALMAEQRGVAGPAAMGSSIVMQLVAIATGAAVAIGLTGSALLATQPIVVYLALLFAVIALFVAFALSSPSLTRRIGFLVGRPDAVQPVDPNALAGAVIANLAAWFGYGTSFWLLVRGTLPEVVLPWTTATGAFAASYLGGYLVLFLPAGFLVRESLLITLLTPVVGLVPATALAAASRVTLTLNEIGAAVPFLLTRRQVASA